MEAQGIMLDGAWIHQRGGALLSDVQYDIITTNSVITDTLLLQTFFLVLAKFLLISMANFDDTVAMHSVCMGFRSVQTSFPVPTRQTLLKTTE